MEHQKKLNLLNEVNDSKFVTRKWNIVNDQSNANYDPGNEIIYNTEKKTDNKIGANESMFILTILEKIKETRLKCFRGSVTVL